MGEQSGKTTRRRFLAQAGVAAGAMQRQDQIWFPSKPTEEKWHRGLYLLLDPAIVARTRGLRRAVTPFTRGPEPVITGSEDGCFQPWVTVIRDPASRRFRVWYNVPRTPNNAGESSVATMESGDGLHWLRPHRVLRDPAPIQYGASVLDEGPQFRDPSKRYKFAWWKDGGMQVAASPNGLAWTPLADGVVVRTNHDITGIDWDPIRSRYVAFLSQVPSSGAYRRLRTPHQSVSDDLVHWREPWPIVTPDANAAIERGETQFYGMSAMVRRGNLLISFVKVLRDDLNCEAGMSAKDLHDPGRPFAGIGYSVLAWSTDGETWRRETQPSLERNPLTGTWDRAMAWVDDQLLLGDEVRLYYGGYRWGHKAERFTGRQIGVAHLPRDRYVGYAPTRDSGTLCTPCRTLGKVHGVKVNAKVAPGGELEVGMYSPICPAIRDCDWRIREGDRVDFGPALREPMGRLEGLTVGFTFTLRNATLYSFELA